MTVRRGESDKTHFRSERYFLVDDQWFFATREGVDVGPFPNRQAAEEGLKAFLTAIKERHMEPDQARQVAISGVWGTNQFS